MNQRPSINLKMINNILGCLIITITLVPTVTKGAWLSYRQGTIELRSPRITKWGNWGSVAYCYEGDYVVKANLLVEKAQGGGDDTGLNAIRLQCQSLNGVNSYELQSAEGQWGDWDGWESCGSDAIATGFKLKSESTQAGGSDLVAATDFKLLCSGPDSKYETYGSMLLDWGYWTGEQRCPSGHAVCGIQTQVEPPVGSGDDTALNNVDIYCCEIEHPTTTCTPSYYWNTEATCSKGQDCSAIYTAKISYNGDTSSHKGGNVASQQFYENLGSGLEINRAYTKLKSKFQNAYSKIVDTEIEDLINYDINTAFRVETTFLDCETAIESLVLKCGIYSIKTREHRCRP